MKLFNRTGRAKIYSRTNTITNTTTASPSYAGNGATVNFATGFQFIANADLQVVVTSSTGVETTKTLNTHYTVTGAGNPSGGTVTFLSAPASGETVNILSNVTLDQQTDYSEGGSFSASTHEDALDKLTKAVQQVKEITDRSVKLSVSDQDVTSSPGVVTADYVLGINAAGTALEWKSPTTLALGTTVTAFAETLLDDATASDARTTLGLGSMATQASSNVAITGGSVSGITDISLADGGTGASLVDPNADRILFWDDSAGQVTWLAPSGNISITGTNIDATSTLDISGLTAIGAALDGANDAFPVYDSSAAANRKISPNNMINALTEDTSPDRTADFVMTYDASATDVKKVKLGSVAGGWVFLGSQTASTSATLDFTTNINSSFDTYVFVGDLVPATDAVTLWVRTSTDGGSTFDAGASDYAYRTFGDNSTTSITSTADTKFPITHTSVSIGNGTGEGISFVMYLQRPSAARIGRLQATAHLVDAAGTTGSIATGLMATGNRRSAADIDGVRFLMSSGNIASGTIRMYGISNS